MREDGYYWIKINDDWVIGKYYVRLDSWQICGDEQDWHPEEIKENKIIQ